MKKNIAILGMMAADMGMGAMPSATHNVTAGQVQHHDALAKDVTYVQCELSQRISRGREDVRGVGSGLSPKYYGQLLQSQGRQKWHRKA